MITHYSSRIQNNIQRELFKATKSIKIAVAWFTNDLLYYPLLLKLGQGVEVEIILNEDEINKGGVSSLDFSEFLNLGGILRWNSSSRLMHDKFCIIDNRVVIFGSYNWTHKAEYNEESISIAIDESMTLDFYSKKFKRLQDLFNVISNYNLPCTSTSQIVCASEDKLSVVDPVEKIINKWKGREELFNRFNTDRGITPVDIREGLVFYPHIEVAYDGDGHRFVFAKKYLHNQKWLYSILDEEHWIPMQDMAFNDYKLIKNKSHGYLWIKIKTNWALFNPHLNVFGSPAVYKIIPKEISLTY